LFVCFQTVLLVVRKQKVLKGAKNGFND